ncbi:MAG: type I restriction enzyme S subunit [Elusimicrobia bacterium]|nr:MAG: type I restriction enzyme S subunit [Elusimicrobiota bacterium]KAF0158134.1 MAG: type I restriction enzyme S subunit [Elusimicrobiota bacterium]
MKFGFSDEQLRQVQTILAKYPVITEAVVFGSRAIGNYKEASDVDIALKGNITASMVADVKCVLEEDTYLPFFFDIIAYGIIDNPKLKEQIDNHGVTLYRAGWKECRLGDIIELVGGGTPKTSVSEYWNGEIPWLSVVDFNTSNKFVYETKKTITKEGLQNSSTKILNKGDIIISARGTVGALAVLKKEMTFNQSCYGIRNRDSVSDQSYLYYLIKDSINNFQQMAHGGVFDTITRETFDQIDVSLPPLPEQRAIAAVLSSLDDKIDFLHRQNKTLESLASALWRKTFIEDTNPKWELGKVSDISSITTGKGLKRGEFVDNGAYPVIGANGEIGRANNFLYDERVILTGRVGTLGKLVISEGKVWVSDNVLIIKPGEDNYFYYSYFLLKQVEFENMNVGSTQPLVTQTDVKNIECALPNDIDLNKFHATVDPLFSKQRNNIKQIKVLSHMRDTLLPKLMSGEVRVKV